ncbi:MAG: hypothetical protein AB9835_10600 [Eubacteriales bacterium]
MPSLRCGFAQRDITPVPSTVFLDGYGFRLAPAQGVRDRLFVKVCALECGDKHFALISFDICGMSPSVYDYVSSHIEEQSGMDRSSFALICTHTHAAPACGVLEGLPLNWDWLASIGAMASEALSEALSKALSGCFTFSFCGDLVNSFNRRGRSPIDRRIRCAVFTGEDGVVRGVLASAACHAVINTSMDISADFPSVLTREAQRLYPGVPALFINGRGADINPYNPDGLSQEELLSALGQDLSDKVFAYVKEKSRKYGITNDTDIMSAYKHITVPMKPYGSAEEYRQKIQALSSAYKKEEDAVTKHCILRELDYNRTILRNSLNGISPDLTVPLQILWIKNIAIFVMLPFEVLTLTGNAVEEILCKRGVTPDSIFICGYSNSVNGYLAPYEEIAYGGYEVSGAAHWYGIAECCEQSERAVLSEIVTMFSDFGSV